MYHSYLYDQKLWSISRASECTSFYINFTWTIPPPHYIAIVYYFFNRYNTTSKYIFVQNYLKIKSQYNSSVF